MSDRIRQIEDIALVARAAFETRTVPRPILRSILSLSFAPGASISELDPILDLFEDVFPYENCDLATGYLQHQLGEGELTIGAFNGRPHVFLSLFVGLERVAVDITADQFGGPPVYVGPLQAPWERSTEYYSLPPT